jgi:hypothetical protein
MSHPVDISRRQFIRTATVAVGGAMSTWVAVADAQPAFGRYGDERPKQRLVARIEGTIDEDAARVLWNAGLGMLFGPAH